MHIFEILAEPIRRRIIDILASGEHFAGDLVDVITHEFGVKPPAVYHHLKLLRDYQFVLTADEWPQRGYRLDPDAIPSLRRAVEEFEYKWERRIGWRVEAESLPRRLRVSNRGRRGHGIDPDSRLPGM